MKIGRFIGSIWALLMCCSLLGGTKIRAGGWAAEALPRYDQLFQRTNDWIGADGDFTVTLTNGLTLWLFSDTFIGDVREGHRAHATMINNSAAWQHGIDPANSTIEFFHKKTKQGKPAPLITPADHRGWFWLYHALMADGRLYLFLPQFEHTAKHTAFGFRQTGLWLGVVSNPLAPPDQWHVVQHPIPFAQLTGDDQRSFGSAVLAVDGYIYIYGFRERPHRGRTMILARAPAGRLADFSTWQFRTSQGWSAASDGTTDLCSDLCSGLATEYSVSFLPAIKQYVAIYTDKGFSDKIMARTAPNPWGPWGAPAAIFSCPETGWDQRNFCYAAKAHPMLASSPDEVILTYAANAGDLAHVLDDARLYWPRFVRVTVK
jgi:hypothetical protein